ncbi:NAD(P)H-hydrate dehydratase [Pedobacter sp. MW01-1-1]|uniref:NAD(P)H-hydrate dehydratase n=1 Tax=Pedobacter sp. MW01-1-1 TaxID=3383027 RepID=UPI003FF03A7A
MQTLLTSAQMRQADEFTIENLPIASIDLMEKAARAFVQAFLRDEFDTNKSIAVFCGTGNNGGDGLAIANLLLTNGYENIKVYLVNFSAKQSADYSINFQRISERRVKKIEINTASDLKNIRVDIIIDAILGSGLNKPLSGEYASLVQAINKWNRKVYSVDVPTGFFAEGPLPPDLICIKAYKTICFQRPKINFFFPESVQATETFEVVGIGLDEVFIQNQASAFQVVQASDVLQRIKRRPLFSHKGTYGHALIIAGNTNTMGAALLSSEACLHAGAGLVTACIPQSGLTALNTRIPEVMAIVRDENTRIQNTAKYHSITIGPGLGTSSENEQFLAALIEEELPLIVDADALTLLANNKELLDKLPRKSILTPHMKEFDRLFGEHADWWSRVQKASTEAKNRGIVLVLKNQYTFICTPEGNIFLNPTGNPAMAQAGMGDVLTGVITAFIAQGYSNADAAMLACYLHGKAGDTLGEQNFVVSASQVATQLSKELKNIFF